MALIYSAPKEIKLPKLNFKDIPKYRKECEQYKTDLREYLLKRNDGKYVGETVHFPVADSYAEYMVASLKPLQLVHIPLWDGHDYEYVHRLTAKDVKEKIDGMKRIAKIFGGKK